MEFIDEAKIRVKSGRGGDGCLSFRRERNVPFGGPDGGDGGKGGSVILRASKDADTLLPLARTQNYAARHGEGGKGHYRHGKSALDVIVLVPVGTVVYQVGYGRKIPSGQLVDSTGNAIIHADDQGRRKRCQIADLDQDGAEFVVVKGGRGGRGNCHFKSAINQCPEETTKGEEGLEKRLYLELKLIADIGLAGFPNAGKSTLLSRLSAAHPKIADYPFTTLKPHLGVVSDGHGHELVMADIPGLIEGAAEGIGLGHDFLRHIERCYCILHLVDIQPIEGDDPAERIRIIKNELQRFSPELAERPSMIAANKMDLTGAETALAKLSEDLGEEVVGISAVTGQGLAELVQKLFTFLRLHKK